MQKKGLIQGEHALYQPRGVAFTWRTHEHSHITRAGISQPWTPASAMLGTISMV